MPVNRRSNILVHLRQKSYLSIEEIATLLSVSEATVRRDLVELEHQGLIIRQRGGASLPGLGVEPLYIQREQENLELKKRIARYAAEQIADGEVIALDVGTTNAELAKELLGRTNLTVFTSSFQVATILSRSRVNVYLVGGYLRKTEMSLVGSIARDTILKFNFDRFYIGLAGITRKDGPTDYSLDDAEIKRAFIERSKEVVVLVDETKFGKSALVKVSELDQITEIITNRETDPRLLEELAFPGKISLV